MPSFREAPFPRRVFAALPVEPACVPSLAAALGIEVALDGPATGAWYALGAMAQLDATEGDPQFAIVDEAERALAELEPVHGSGDFKPVWLGGFAFDPARTDKGIWKEHPAARLVLPELTLHAQDDRAWAIAVADDRNAAGLLDRLARNLDRTTVPPAATALPQVLSVVPEVSRESWDAGVDGILRNIELGAIRKAVLARTLRVELSEQLEPQSFLSHLGARFPDCVRFAFRGGDSTFLGATPELLFHREGSKLRTMALAGSTRRDPDPARDLELARKLFVDPKENAEHQLVVDALREALAPLTETLTLDGPQIRALSNIQHLETRFDGELRKNVSARALLESLHPTPAVCGTPRNEARALLRDVERFPRGWYAGPIGFVGETSSVFMVALRCALVRGTEARLFTGAGIVAGSTAEGEWRETELKSRALLGALSEATR